MYYDYLKYQASQSWIINIIFDFSGWAQHELDVVTSVKPLSIEKVAEVFFYITFWFHSIFDSSLILLQSLFKTYGQSISSKGKWNCDLRLVLKFGPQISYPVKVRLQTEWQGFDDSGVLFNLEKYKVTTSSKIIYNKKMIIIISKLRYIYVSLFAENNTIVGEVPHCLVS